MDQGDVVAVISVGGRMVVCGKLMGQEWHSRHREMDGWVLCSALLGQALVAGLAPFAAALGQTLDARDTAGPKTLGG